jgi:ABC-type oligopeptide transport system ATPase subunit
MNTTVLRVKDLIVTYKLGKGKSLASVQEASFELKAGETLGIVGESGSGKTTLARIILRLIVADSGQVLFHGENLSALDSASLKNQRKKIQIDNTM